MANETSKWPEQPTEPVQRRPTDALWFAVLLASIATGISMTIFAPVGGDPPATISSAPPPMPTTATATATATGSSTSPSTVPAP